MGPCGSRYDAAFDLPVTLGFERVTGLESHRRRTEAVIAQIRARVGSGPLYLGFDIDFIDPTFAPGTGTPEVGGATSVQALELLRGLAGLEVVAYNLVEVIPPTTSARRPVCWRRTCFTRC